MFRPPPKRRGTLPLAAPAALAAAADEAGADPLLQAGPAGGSVRHRLRRGFPRPAGRASRSSRPSVRTGPSGGRGRACRRCRCPPAVATPSSTSRTASFRKTSSMRLTAKPATSLTADRHLVGLAHQAQRGFDRLGRGVEGGDHLDQLHARGRREIMRADEIAAAAPRRHRRRGSRSGSSRYCWRRCSGAGRSASSFL